MTFKKKVLKNGLRIIAVPMEGAPSVTVMALVETGSEYEKKDKNGISHFLEHMCFKGTEKRPNSIDISKELDSIGSSYNAFTSYEMTGYHAKAHYKHFDKILDVVSDIYLNPKFPEGEMEKEKGVIIEEINMYEDMPKEKVGMVYDQLLYGDQPAGWSILGPKKNIKSMKRSDFLDYRKIHYVPAKTVIVVAGNVLTHDAFKKVENIFKDIPSGKAVKKKKVIERQNAPALKVEQKDTDQAHLIIGTRAFNLYDKRIPALRLMSAILGNGMSSRLFQKMRGELGICYYVYSGVSEFCDHGHFHISAGVDRSRLELAVKEILKELQKIRDEKVDYQELKKAKDYIIGGMYLGLESSDALANFYGGQEIMREKIKTPKMIEEEIKKITAHDIQKVAQGIIKSSRLNMAMVGRCAEAERRNLRKILSV